ncbi:DUF4189 domain-containing protein [Stenotrophomonas sp. SPM]|uniref:DUF4189 domain-containing protein n=1 Tax=Stenotrophomonas sp. SPM TaxID=2170735 RepID=UPI001FAEDAB0|nr:DUF4189 domain-containing protein [Stenotrophomonas sp. SPM]
MKRHPPLFVLCLLLIAGALPFSALAEGNCPPGMYPIGGQGVQGCGPIPAGGGDQGGLKPNGKWIKTWGAISYSEKVGTVGAVVGMLTKSDAAKEAQDRCTSQGASDCRVLMTYKNQCAAYAYGKGSGMDGVVSTTRARSKDEAASAALKHCAADGGQACKVVYTDCSEPLLQKF